MRKIKPVTQHLSKQTLHLVLYALAMRKLKIQRVITADKIVRNQSRASFEA